MTTVQTPIEEHIAFLTVNIKSDLDHLLLLRSALEAALFKLGYGVDEVKESLDHYYSARRTVH